MIALKDLRWFPAVTTHAFFGMLLHNWILTSMESAAREITLGAGLALSWFLFLVVVFSLLPFQGSRGRPGSSARAVRPAVGAGALVLASGHVLLLPLGLWYTVRYESLGLLPLLVTAETIGLAALAVLLWQRPWRHQARAADRPEVPRLLGLRDPARMPPGWVPVVFYRSDLFPHNLRDHPLEIDGDRVGELPPGESLVIGLPPGEHTARIPVSPGKYPFRFAAVPGRTVHLYVGADTRIALWNPTVTRQEHSA
ncbi:hypothetical protein [Nocardiopsis sp. NPDC057823]|uniref:hypothetical protein n=1 Tax=Nocardiopsis sp. NPDC057823 TaxID=3346256 RepID=UPI00366E3750